MQKKQIEIIIIGVLAVVLVFSLLPFIKSGKAPSAYKASTVSGQNDRQGTFIKAQAVVAVAADKHDSLAWGRDPFSLEAVAPSEVNSPSNLTLMGIIRTGNGDPKAIINNDIYPLGSKIGSFTLKQILKTKVVVTDGEKDYDLNLY